MSEDSSFAGRGSVAHGAVLPVAGPVARAALGRRVVRSVMVRCCEGDWGQHRHRVPGCLWRVRLPPGRTSGVSGGRGRGSADHGLGPQRLQPARGRFMCAARGSRSPRLARAWPIEHREHQTTACVLDVPLGAGQRSGSGGIAHRWNMERPSSAPRSPALLGAKVPGAPRRQGARRSSAPRSPALPMPAHPRASNGRSLWPRLMLSCWRPRTFSRGADARFRIGRSLPADR